MEIYVAPNFFVVQRENTLHCFDKNIVVLTPLPGRMRTILPRTGEEGGGEGAHTHACMQHRVASKRSFESAGPILNTCLHRLSRTFFWRLENFSLLSLLPSLSLVDSFIHKGNRVSRMYTLTFATFLLYVHVYTMKRFLARLSVSS